MKTILSGLSDDNARKELRLFAVAGCAMSVLSLIALWWLGFAGLAFSSRALLLSWHKVNRENPDNVKLRVIAAAGFILSAIGVIYGLS